jgi:hypothetical protein
VTNPDRQLDVLVDRAARGVLTPAESAALRVAVAVLQAEVRKAQRTTGGLTAKVKRLGGELKTAEAERTGAYNERAHLLAWLASIHPAVLASAPDVSEPGWQILYLTAGGLQLSWHIAPGDAELFTHVEQVSTDDQRAQWDGHTTEQKYERIRTAVRGGASTKTSELAARLHRAVEALQAADDYAHPSDAIGDALRALTRT